MQKAEGRKRVQGRRSEVEVRQRRLDFRLPPSAFRFRRRGMSMIIVLGIIAVTLATSYALMRGEFYEVRVQQNSNRQGLARQAALAGISVAMEHMGLSMGRCRQHGGWRSHEPG